MLTTAASCCDEPAADRVAGELDAVAHSELLEDVGAVSLHRLLRDVQEAADLVVGMGFGDELEDLFLTRRQQLAVRIAAAQALEVFAHEGADAVGIQERLSTHR